MASRWSSRPAVRWRDESRPLVVQQSFPEPRPTTNPYIVMLRDSLAQTPGVTVRTFSWPAALLGRYDVFHVHWPEILPAGRSPLKTLARQALTSALLLRLAVTRTPVVRTLHNLGRPANSSRRTGAILSLLERRTTLVIGLNEATPLPPGPSETIVHGHYRSWFAPYDQPPPREGQLGYFGLIRPYKGVDRLVQAFRQLQGPYALRIAGHPTPELSVRLSQLASGDDRVQLTLAYISDADLVRVAGESELVVLPYTEMHNSGGALAALSLDRPILVPANEVNERLQAEVGARWVHTYQGELTPETLLHALEAARSVPGDARPDLTRRGWEQAGQRHLSAYRRALELKRSR